MTDRILRFAEANAHLAADIERLSAIGEVTACRVRRLYSRRTRCSLSTELLKLRAAGKGPTFVVGKGTNGHLGYYYRFDELLAFFGGVDALFHRADRPELFVPVSGSFGVPSAQHAKRRAAP